MNLKANSPNQRQGKPAVPLSFPFVLVLVMLQVSGCKTRRPPPPPIPKKLNDIPVHQLSRTKWDTSASCMVFEGLNQAQNRNIMAMVKVLKEVLKENGYTVLKPNVYMTSKQRQSVKKVIRVEQFVSRVSTIKGVAVHDCMLELIVEDPLPNPLVKKKQKRRHFEIWGRKEGGAPHRAAAENAMRITALREALEP